MVESTRFGKGVGMILYKLCSCGRRVKMGDTCPCKKERHKEYDRFRRDKTKASFYHGTEWKKATKLCKLRAAGLDQVKLSKGELVYGQLSHHIIELEEDPSKALDMSNLIYVSQATHNAIHRAYNESEQKKRAVQDFLKSLVGGEG